MLVFFFSALRLELATAFAQLPVRSDEGLTLKTSALELFTLSLILSLDNTEFSLILPVLRALILLQFCSPHDDKRK